MKITIEGTASEIKELGLSLQPTEVVLTNQEIKIEKNEKEDGIFHENGWITLRYNGKEISIADKNVGAKKVGDYGKLMTHSEAITHCKRLATMHLPSKDEWIDLVKLWAEFKGYEYSGGVWSSENDGEDVGRQFAKDFELPFAGYRSYSSAGVSYQGSYGCCWSSSRNSTSSAYRLYFDSTALNPQIADGRAYGFSVRCFKNSQEA